MSKSYSQLELSYLFGGLVHYRPGENLKERVGKDYEIVIIYQGAPCYVRNFQKYQLGPGSILLSRPGENEQWHWDKENYTRHGYLHFKMNAIPKKWGDPDDWPLFRSKPNLVCASIFEHLLERISYQNDWPVQSPEETTILLVDSLISLFLEEGKEKKTQSVVRNMSVSRAINHMRLNLEENPETELTLDKLAQTALVSKKHLCRLFTSTMGIPPMRFYLLLKLQLALSLLKHSNYIVAEIARRCGFSDASYFSRAFSDAFSMPPSEARRRILSGEEVPVSPLPADVIPRVQW